MVKLPEQIIENRGITQLISYKRGETMVKVQLEMELEELKDIKCLLKIEGDTGIVEGELRRFEAGYVKVYDTENNETSWVAEEAIEVVKVLFRT